MSMTPSFSVNTTSRYERLSDALLRRHTEFENVSRRAREILGTDPYNRTRRYHIKKLEGVSHGEGQYRLSLGRFRFRYDIYSRDVVLQRCGLRREDTYRR